MHSIGYSADRAATPVAHCFSPSDLMPLVRAHADRTPGRTQFGGAEGLLQARPETCFQGLVFYLSGNTTQASHQLGAIAGLMQQLYLQSLPRAVRAAR